jgi:hypothetical protein
LLSGSGKSAESADLAIEAAIEHRPFRRRLLASPFPRYDDETSLNENAALHHRRLTVFDKQGPHPTEIDCVAGVGGLELRNVVTNYPFEKSRRFLGFYANSGHRDHSLLSCGG